MAHVMLQPPVQCSVVQYSLVDVNKNRSATLVAMECARKAQELLRRRLLIHEDCDGGVLERHRKALRYAFSPNL